MKEVIAITLYGENLRETDISYTCKNVHNGDEYSINGLKDETYSSSKFSKTEKVTKTRLAEILVTAGDKPFTVEYFKQNGKLRTLVGRLITPEPLMGRSLVEDFFTDHSGLRQVDHRTIQSIIIGGTKFILS